MNMTTTKSFAIEFYNDDQCEESDPDPVYTGQSDNTDDLFTHLSEELNYETRDIVYIYLDMIDRDLRYSVYDRATKTNIGVAIVVYP